MVRIGVVGDHDSANPTHVATTAALRPGNRFVATLFGPQTSSTPEHPHPLVTALVTATAADRPRSA